MFFILFLHLLNVALISEEAAFQDMVVLTFVFLRQATQRRAGAKNVGSAGESQGAHGAAGAADDAAEGTPHPPRLPPHPPRLTSHPPRLTLHRAGGTGTLATRGGRLAVFTLISLPF